MRHDVDWAQGADWAELRAYRIKRLVEAMRHHGLDAVMYTRLDAVRYVTSFRPVYSMWFHGTRYIVVVTASGHITFLVASGDYARVKATMPWLTDLVPFPFVMADGLPLITEALGRLGLSKGRIGADLLPMSTILPLQKSLKVEFADAMPVLEDARKIKHPTEIEMLRHAAHLADIGMQAALDAVQEGVTEAEVSAAATYAMMAAGSEDVPYYPLVESGQHSWLGYRFPTTKRLRHGEMVWIDCGCCIWNGYNGDISRITVVGEPTPEQARLYEAVYEMLEACKSKARAGVSLGEMVDAAMAAARKYGYEDHTYFGILGHGIGTDLHEGPTIGEKVVKAGQQEERLERNMVISTEPAISLPGIGGGHLEDMMVITDGEPEILTKTRFEEWMM